MSSTNLFMYPLLLEVSWYIISALFYVEPILSPALLLDSTKFDHILGPGLKFSSNGPGLIIYSWGLYSSQEGIFPHTQKMKNIKNFNVKLLG